MDKDMQLFVNTLQLAADRIENGQAGSDLAINTADLTEQQFIELLQVQSVLSQLVFGHIVKKHNSGV